MVRNVATSAREAVASARSARRSRRPGAQCDAQNAVPHHIVSSAAARAAWSSRPSSAIGSAGAARRGSRWSTALSRTSGSRCCTRLPQGPCARIPTASTTSRTRARTTSSSSSARCVPGPTRRGHSRSGDRCERRRDRARPAARLRHPGHRRRQRAQRFRRARGSTACSWTALPAPNASTSRSSTASCAATRRRVQPGPAAALRGRRCRRHRRGVRGRTAPRRAPAGRLRPARLRSGPRHRDPPHRGGAQRIARFARASAGSDGARCATAASRSIPTSRSSG